MLSKLLRLGEGRMVKRLQGWADYVNTLSDDIEKLSDAELRGKTAEFKQRIDNGQSLDDILPEAFAVAREASSRVLSQRHFDVQIMGGAALHFGNVAEMRTGEGKTLTCVLPAYLNALGGRVCTSLPSTTTSPNVTRSGWGVCIAHSDSPAGDSDRSDARRAPSRLCRRHHL